MSHEAPYAQILIGNRLFFINPNAGQPKYQSPDEVEFMDRVAIGSTCRCNDCMCCADFRTYMKRRT